MNKMKSILGWITVYILNLLTFSYIWCIGKFGNISFNEIVFTLNMPLKGASINYFYSYYASALFPSIILLFLEIAIFIPTKYEFGIRINIKNNNFEFRLLPIAIRHFSRVMICIVWLGILVYNANNKFEIFDYVKNQINSSTFIEEEYTDTSEVDITFPKAKRNLIWIFMESAETSYQDRGDGGLLDENVIPEMTNLAKNNISFSQSDLIEGATVAPFCGWTIAGLVAQTSGLPLKLYSYDNGQIDNSMGNYTYFMPGAVTLGEILQKEGYKNVFMEGSETEFAGKSDYLTQHGNYEIYDYNVAIEKGKIPEDYVEGWGFEDKKLYEYAKEELLELSSTEQPFSLLMLTVDTHMDGYICDLCPDIYDNYYYNVWACASKQVYDFVEWVSQQDFYENTTICITGDHCSMEVGIMEDYEYDKHNGGGIRKVYNVIINSAIDAINEKNRKFTTMDMFPTVLASLGAEIDGNRLGLGTNLFSDTPTLLEECDEEVFFNELEKKSNFYNDKILYK